MTNHYEKREKYATLLLSLSLHIIFILALLLITHKQTYFAHKKLLLDKLTDDPLTLSTAAALKPKASSFGAPLIFQEEPENQPTLFDPRSQDEFSQEAINDKQEEPPTGQSTKKEKVETEEQPEPEKPKETTKQEEKPEQKKPTQTEQILEQEAPYIEKAPEISPEQEKPQVKPEEKPIEPTPTIKKIKPQPQRVSRQIPDKKAQSAGPIKRKLTFADLAQGFIESIKNEGDDWLERKGDPNKRPDFKDLKYLSYVQKLIWYMQNEWKAHQSKLNVNFTQDLILSLIVTVLKDGTLGGIQIIQPSGSNELDSFLIKGIENAGPYPEVPNHFDTDSFDFPLAIHNRHQENSGWKMRLPAPPMNMR